MTSAVRRNLIVHWNQPASGFEGATLPAQQFQLDPVAAPWLTAFPGVQSFGGNVPSRITSGRQEESIVKCARFHQIALGLCVLCAAAGTLRSRALEPLPAGDTGVAAKYPEDAGIGKDAAVVFAHDFEDVSTVAELRRRWDSVFHDDTLAITADSDNVHGGGKAVEMVFRRKDGEAGNGLMKRLAPERNVLFLRFYQKFDHGLDVKGAGSFHNGGTISAHYHVDGRSTPGKRADGRNKFLVSSECSVYSQAPPPGNLTVYVYHPEQRGDYGDIFYFNGLISPNTSLPGDFGADFVARPPVLPGLGRWHCHELMVRANTVGQRDGRIACWLDGKLVADFPNMRFRDVADLGIDYITIGGYINPNKVRTNKIWFDDVVAATSYIGPRRSSKP